MVARDRGRGMGELDEDGQEIQTFRFQTYHLSKSWGYKVQ